MKQLPRAELVERLVASERRARVAEAALRDCLAWAGGDRSEASYVIALLARNEVLEQNVARLVNERARRAA